MTLHRGIAANLLALQASQFGSAVYAAGSARTVPWDEIFTTFDQIPDVVDEGADEPLPGFGPISDDAAMAVASSAARAVHARMNEAFTRAAGSAIDPGQSLGLLGGAEAGYDARLAELRAAAASEDRSRAVDAFNAIVDDIAEIDAMLHGIGLLAPAIRSVGNLGLRASDLGRRYAMLTAGAIQVMRRLSTGRGATGMKRIADNRGTLRRYDTAQWQGFVPLAGLSEGPDQVVCGEIAETGWVNRPEIPYSFLRLTDGAELRIHRRDIKQNGVVPGALAWIRGKVETTEDGAKILVAQFEGPGSHASRIWEDWLADEVRHAYDLYPRVIDGNWELPPVGVRYAAGDMLSRVWEENNAG